MKFNFEIRQPMTMAEVTAAYIKQVLEFHNGDRPSAARAMGMKPSSMLFHLKRYSIKTKSPPIEQGLDND